MRVAIVQFAPKIGKVQENIQKAHKLCQRLQPDSVDLVCLPEMIFSGYVFPDAASISPYLEEPRTGPTSMFCASLAARLRCYVVAGYPERLRPEEVHRAILPAPNDDDENGTETREVDKIGANSAALYGPDGQFVGDYRKTNLYETDMTWARAGTGFTTFHLPPPLNTVSLGICMDLNVQPPAMWDLTLGPYEIAEYCIAQRTNLLILLNAWLDSKESPEEDIDWRTINYWALRLRPLWAKVVEEVGGRRPETFSSLPTTVSNPSLTNTLPVDAENTPKVPQAHSSSGNADDVSSDSESDPGSDSELNLPRDGRRPGEELVVVVCNRCGEENGITFAGSSSLFILKRGAGRPRLLRAMTRREEGLEVWNYPKSQEPSHQ